MPRGLHAYLRSCSTNENGVLVPRALARTRPAQSARVTVGGRNRSGSTAASRRRRGFGHGSDRHPSSVVSDFAKALEVDDDASRFADRGSRENDNQQSHVTTEATAVTLSIRALLQSMPSSTRKHSIAAVGAELARSRSALRDEIAGKANATRYQLGGRELQLSQGTDILQTATAYGGLFYLLSTVLELGIGESLWKACLPEGQILAGAAATLLGPASSGDPAPALFGGVATREVFETPDIQSAQHAEVSSEVLGALVGAFSRRKLAMPSVFLELVESSAGRLLIAFTTGSFVLFAWPSPDSTTTAAGIAAFLKSWPHFAPAPKATNALIALDRDGRLRQNDASSRTSALLLTSAPSAPTAVAICLLAQICGSMHSCLARGPPPGPEKSPVRHTPLQLAF